ncbi:VapC toxin family PIN domain ribonuclease [Rhodococcus antarcticus]|uniref:VapC toxin family PIN domain ribonuclease n=1 Tax=Rhodococcus antarcticus TaxID=2987751 RepID=A0ABY6P075_9NOCA|nr:PIN domain-containing protein [Rhodococcus antarcticus]UZJ24874.1 VapC toxin family PIN domain ribonuclease [Rhodococcus antarcticus]
MSVLVDTSVWVDHLRTGNPRLAALLEQSRVLIHPWVLGELALGGVIRNAEVSTLLGALPRAPLVSDSELVGFIQTQALHGRGVGYVDAQLLASTVLDPDAVLWSADKGLSAAAAELGVAHQT